MGHFHLQGNVPVAAAAGDVGHLWRGGCPPLSRRDIRYRQWSKCSSITGGGGGGGELPPEWNQGKCSRYSPLSNARAR